MSGGLKGSVGAWKLEWETAPRGRSGSAYVRVGGGGPIEVRWRRDDDGLWIELHDGVFGYDVQSVVNDDGVVAFDVARRDGNERFLGVGFTRAGDEALTGGARTQKKGLRVRAPMPGKIVRVLVAPGDVVVKDQPLLVMEAMKMENEIRAAQAGKVALVKVAQGQGVESGADLMTLE